jgi:hypothetical protein
MKYGFVAVLAVLVMGSAACSSATGGVAAPATQASQSSQAGGNSEVRKVAKPLDLVKFEANPCGLVPQAVAAELGFVAPGTVTPKEQAVAGPYCGWINQNNGRNLTVTIPVGNRDAGIGGLAGLYAGHESGQMPFLEKAPDVLGYQALFADLQDRRPRGSCNLHVGVSDDLVFSVGDQGYTGQQDSCDAAQKVAAAVVKTLMEA